ncbi:MAG: stage V sporulation protein D [Lachnospiraceae bacterium]|nr:stage V sporulation protein D [Lachnospiraceae bacterium]
MPKKNINKQNTTKLFSKRLLICAICISVIFFALIIRLIFLQFVQGSELKESAYRQQTTNKIISAKRGTIYDSTGKVLAKSIPVDTISINPQKVKYSDEKDVPPEVLTQIFVDVFGLDYNSTLEKVTKNASTVVIVSKIEKEKVDIFKQILAEKKITSGINIDNDTKRYYPYDSLASTLIGSFGTDNGLAGIESAWDSVLTGTRGRKTTTTDSANNEIPNADQSYVAAQNGYDLTLTIDVNIQSIAEKYLTAAVTENTASRGGNVIIMNPSSGDILAMASSPVYNLNEPFSVDMSTWNNTTITNTYEPGSTFKLINAAIALEENIIDTDTKSFYCNSYENISGTIIKCWKYPSMHESQSLREALMNSCNPSFMQLISRIDKQTLYKYYEAFGLFSRTGISSAGEGNSLFHDINNLNSVELATMSFGQRINVTPIQLITAVSAIANDGVLVQPKIVKELTNTDTGAVTTIDTVNVRQVISKETSSKMLDMMQSVVTDGTGRYAAIPGYSIGGKTGTSEANPNKPDEGYTASYIAVSPALNPEIIILVTLYGLNGTSYQGSSVAGPVVKQILSEVLPYMGIASTQN